MKHSFVFGNLDKSLCALCKRGLLAHGKNATCEACGKIGNHEIFGDPRNEKAMLLCIDCEKLEVAANDVAIAQMHVAKAEATIGKDVIEEARKLDANVHYKGDFFNAETVAIGEIWQALKNDESIDENQKTYKLHEIVLERIKTFGANIFDLDKKKFEEVSKQQAGIQFLRAQGNAVRQAVRDQMREADSSYVPNVVAKPPKNIKAPKQTIGTWDRVAQAIAKAQNISIEEASKMMREKKIL